MNNENQQPKQADTNDQNKDDSSRSPGVDRGVKNSENAPENNNTQEPNQKS